MELRSGRRLRSSQQQQGSPCGGGRDRISALPDDLLLLILARLRCIATAARTSVLSRGWSGGLWTRLGEIVFRGVPFPSLEAALGSIDSPAVSLLEIRVPYHRSPSPVPDPAGVNSLLCASARLAPEKFIFALPGHFNSWSSINVDLSSFHRATSIELDSCLLFLRVPAGVDFPALETLSLSGRVPDLDRLLSCCPRLRTLRLSSVVYDSGYLRVSSALLQELVVHRSSERTGCVSIIAPVLKQLTLSFMASDVSISVLAPMLEKVYWHCWYCTYDRASAAFGLWRLQHVTLHTSERQGELPSLKIRASAVHPFSCSIYCKPYSQLIKSVNDIYPVKLFFQSSYGLRGEEMKTFAQEIEKHMIAKFSVLELYLITNGHVFGGLAFHLLGMIRICGHTQRLMVTLHRSTVKEKCPFDCPCEPSNWRSPTISLSALEEVEINGFKGYDHEIDFMKLIFKCAPMLKNDCEAVTRCISK